MGHGALVRRPDLPAGLGPAAFTVAQARELGLRPSDLRRRGLHRPTRGVRTAAPPDGLMERARAFAEVLPADAAYSHVTAARLHGLPLPAPHEESLLLEVMGPSGRAPTRRAGCRGRLGVEGRDVVVRSGVRFVSAMDTWCDLGAVQGPRLGVDDLVVAGDAVVSASVATDPVGHLAAILSGRVRPRGARALTEALAHVRVGVRSPMETRTRLMFVRSGFPEPEVNAVVTDVGGAWLLEGDLVWRRARVIGEYQGADHADRRRRSADAHRLGLARDEGWPVLEIWAEDVYTAPRRRTCLRRFAAALGLDPATLTIA